MAFTITTNVGGTAATVVGTNSSDSIAAAQLANIASLSLTAFDADDVVVTGTTALTSATSISMGQGDDQVTLSAGLSASGSLVDLGEGSDTFTGGNNSLSNVSIKGFGGLDTMTFDTATGGTTLRSIFVNGNEGADRITVGAGGNTAVASSTIVGGSEDDRITLNTIGAVTGGRINGQNGDDVITVTNIGAATTTTIYGGQGNDTLAANTTNVVTSFVIFSGDLGNDSLTGGAQNSTTQGGDLLFGGDGNDTLSTGGRGMDTLTGGNGIDTFVVNTANDGFQINYVAVAGNATGSIVAGDAFQLNSQQGLGSFNNFLTNTVDFSSVDALDTANNSNAVSGLGVAVTNNVSNDVIGTAGFTYKLAGTYNAANSTFTVTADNLGTDTLLILNGANAGAILMNGTSASSLVAANFV